ncbi:thiamine ABC transporter ATP-binding protein ThiQ [Utexia brackfieldae]|uniref:thiamine ABC transporter ATP-binding protein ThiQ n=1 Tax=Utexia brackfieldae TaxID=3074108 RepID=UPI00370DB9F1
MIELKQVSYQYQQENMQFSFSIQPHERVAIIGPSGAGKSTLLSLIAGFIDTDSGQIILANQDVTLIPPNRRPVSMLFQDNNLFTHLTVAQNMGLGLNPSLRLSAAQQQDLADIAEKVGLDSLLQRYPDQLSGGQRQRVALARCLLQKRPILLLDEPFSSLDPALRTDMLSLVQRVCEQYQLTLLMITHNLDDAMAIAPRTLVIKQGQIVFDQPTQTLVDNVSALYATLSDAP